MTTAERVTADWLVGTGMLAEAIAVAVPADDPPVLVTASDSWTIAGPDLAASEPIGADLGREAVRRRAAARGVGWLPVRTELAQVVIGPWEVAGRPGCVTCAQLRRARIHPDRRARAAVWHAHQRQLATRAATLLTGLAARLVATVVADEVSRSAAGAGPRTVGALLLVDLIELAVTRHPFLADPTCPDCGDLPDDTAAELALRPRPAYRPGSYRFRSLVAELDGLVGRYVDEQAGLVRCLDEGRDGTRVVTQAPLGMRVDLPVEGYGRSSDSRTSHLIGLLEALERYGCTPGARRTMVRASYAELGDSALDPRGLGLHAPDQYEAPGFPFEPFDPQRPYRWVWGWSFARQGPVLVPELVAYYGLPCDPDGGAGFVLEISNGCALGGCLEEAILYAILEVAERDAFLLTWHARLAAPRVDLATATDPTLRWLAASIGSGHGPMSVEVYDISVEQGIPCACALAVNPDPGDGRPALVVAAGAHPDPQRAVRQALTELGPSLAELVHRYAQPDQQARAAAMVDDPDQVVQMDDHLLLYGHPAAAARLSFLTGADRACAVGEIGARRRGGFASDDLRDNVQEAVDRYLVHDLDVVVVDQTTPEHRAGGLSCVKVVVPGTLPMTFGHRFRRLHHLPRLFDVPVLLGCSPQRLVPSDLNLHPHPFP